MCRTIGGVAALIVVLLAAPGPAPARAGCITSLPVSFRFPTPFAAAYGRTLPVTLTARGVPIRNPEAKLYTFGGDLIAQGRSRRTVRSSLTIPMRLRFGLQPGRFTLTLFGEPNADRACGPKHAYPTVRFQDCPERLPVTFPRRPQGAAADFGGLLTVRVAASGLLLRDVSVSMSTFAGDPLGTVGLPTVFGTVAANFDFPEGVPPGAYTVFVSGRLARQPRACGPASAKTVVTLT